MDHGAHSEPNRTGELPAGGRHRAIEKINPLFDTARGEIIFPAKLIKNAAVLARHLLFEPKELSLVQTSKTRTGLPPSTHRDGSTIPSLWLR